MRCFILFCLMVSCLGCYSQTVSLPFQRFPSIPPFKIMLGDSSIFVKEDLHKNKATWFIIFGPDCEHCQDEARQIMARQKELKDLQIVMITLHPLPRMKAFISDYKLGSVKNIVVGQDYSRFTMDFFGFKNIPFQALYNKKGKLLSSFEGTKDIGEIISILKD